MQTKAKETMTPALRRYKRLSCRYLASIRARRFRQKRKFISSHGSVITKFGGGFLILIGLLQVSDLWDQLMNSLRDLISGFIPII